MSRVGIAHHRPHVVHVVVGSAHPTSACYGARNKLSDRYRRKSQRFRHMRKFFPKSPTLAARRLPPWSCRASPGAVSFHCCNLFGVWNLQSPLLHPRLRCGLEEARRGRFSAAAQRGNSAVRKRRKVPVANNLTLIARTTMMIGSAAATVAPRNPELRMDGRRESPDGMRVSKVAVRLGASRTVQARRESPAFKCFLGGVLSNIVPRLAGLLIGTGNRTPAVTRKKAEFSRRGSCREET